LGLWKGHGNVKREGREEQETRGMWRQMKKEREGRKRQL